VVSGSRGWRRWQAAPHARGPAAVGDEVDDALLDLEGSGGAEERGRLAEDGVLSWRTGMKQFGVRGLSAAFHKYTYESVRPSRSLRTGPSRRLRTGPLRLGSAQASRRPFERPQDRPSGPPQRERNRRRIYEMLHLAPLCWTRSDRQTLQNWQSISISARSISCQQITVTGDPRGCRRHVHPGSKRGCRSWSC